MTNRFYYGISVVLLLILLLLKINSDNKADWTETYRHDKSNPYAGEILYDYLKQLEKNELKISLSPVYNSELNEDSLLLFISSQLSMDRLDLTKLYDYIEKGGHVFLSARSFSNQVLDTFNLKLEPELQDTDSNFITLNLNRDNYDFRFSYRPTFFLGNFSSKEKKEDFDVISRSSEGTKYWIRKKIGEGEIHFHSFPYVFSNYFIMKEENRRYLEELMNMVYKKNLQWMEYYSGGRAGSKSPLRYALSSEGLKKAIYIGVFATLIFMFFSLKRKASPIPVIKTPENISLNFIKTLGMLLYQQRNHRDIAIKRFRHFQDFNRKHYYLNDWTINDVFFENLSKKSSIEFSKIKTIFDSYQRIRQSMEISKEDLISFNEKLEEYYKLNTYKKELI